MTPAEILTKAADLLEKPGAWTQKELGRRADGTPIRCGEDMAEAVCYCISGAIIAIAGPDHLMRCTRAVEKVTRKLPVIWNDAPERTQAEVVAKLREAAAKARGQ